MIACCSGDDGLVALVVRPRFCQIAWLASSSTSALQVVPLLFKIVPLGTSIVTLPVVETIWSTGRLPSG